LTEPQQSKTTYEYTVKNVHIKSSQVSMLRLLERQHTMRTVLLKKVI